MDHDTLVNWAKRAHAELQSYAADARAAGSLQERTEELVAEFTDIKRGRPVWKYRLNSGHCEWSRLDEL